MNREQQNAILTIALFAAFADASKDERERMQIRDLADSLGQDQGSPDLARLYREVLLKQVSLDSAAAKLTDAGERQLAYEMAVCVCDADGRQCDAERGFLAELRKLLQLDTGQAAAFDMEANTFVDLAEAAVPVAAGAAVTGPTAAERPRVDDVALDKAILNSALINGALEILPQSWASMAIIPLQIKMVYAVGMAHGISLDQGHIKEFIAAAGVGLTSQYLEQIGRKLLGGLLGKMAGKTFGSAGGAATGMAFSFATTYALGHLAKCYYSGGRVMNATILRDTYQNLLEPAKQMQAQYLPQIRQQAQALDMGKVMALLRGR